MSLIRYLLPGRCRFVFVLSGRRRLNTHFGGPKSGRDFWNFLHENKSVIFFIIQHFTEYALSQRGDSMTSPSEQVISEVNSVPVRERKYWGFRTDKDYQVDLFEELKAGRLRQGWGYDESQDLRIIKQIIDSGGEWWKRMSEKRY